MVAKSAAKSPMPPRRDLVAGGVKPRYQARLLGATMLAALLGYGGWIVSQDETLPIRSVQIEASFQQLSAAALNEALSASTQGGFFSVDVHAVKHAAESLPWVDRAAVRRIWPDTLRLTIKEQQPLARWQVGGLVNRRGELFQAEQTNMVLPLLSGPAASVEKVAAHFQRWSQQLSVLGVAVAELHLSARRAWTLRLDNGLLLVVGQAVSERPLARFIQAYPQVLAPRLVQIEQVDIRYTNGFAVRWRKAKHPIVFG